MPETKSYVIDASVAVKWFTYEEGTDQARAILKKGQGGALALLAPDLLLYEVGNALAKGKGLAALTVREALALLQSDVALQSLDRLLIERTASFVEEYGLTFYDAVYVALAEQYNAILVTANPKDHRKVREIGLLILK